MANEIEVTSLRPKTSAASANLVTEPGFEAAGAGGADIWDGWTENAGNGTLANETTAIHGGSDAMKATAGAAADTYVSQNLTVVAGSTYRLSFWTRGGDATNNGRYKIYDNDNTADISALAVTGVSSVTYTQVGVLFTAPVGCTTAILYFYCPATNTKIAYFDDVNVSLDEALYRDSPTRVLGISLRGGSANSTMEFYNASATSTAEAYSCAVPAGGSYVENFGNLPLTFSAKMLAFVEGTGALGYVWYD